MGKEMKMTLNELYVEVKRYIDQGYGHKEIVVSEENLNGFIDSIQSNRMPCKEPDYFIILMKG